MWRGCCRWLPSGGARSPPHRCFSKVGGAQIPSPGPKRRQNPTRHMPRRSPDPRIIFRGVARQSHRTGIACVAGLAQISGGLNPESQCARAVGGTDCSARGEEAHPLKTLYSRVWDKLGNVLQRALCIEGDYAHGSANALPLQVALASLRTLETRITTKKRG